MRVLGTARASRPQTRGVRTMEKKYIKQHLSESVQQEQGNKKMSPFGYLFRFIGWWFGFTGLYTMFAVCPDARLV